MKIENKTTKIVNAITNLLCDIRDSQTKLNLDDQENHNVVKTLENSKSKLEFAIGNNKENFESEAKQALSIIESLQENVKRGLKNAVLRDVKKLQTTVNKISDIINGKYITTENVKNKKQIKTEKQITKTDLKIKELEDVREKYLQHKLDAEDRIEDYLEVIENLNQNLLNQAKQNKLATVKGIYGDIKKQEKSKQDTCKMRDVYGSCFKLMDDIISKLKEKLKLGEFDSKQVKEVNFFIDNYLNNLNLVSDSSQAFKVLRDFDAGLQKIVNNTAKIDEYYAKVEEENSADMSEIQQYILKLQQEEELNNQTKLEQTTKNKNKNGGENNGVL